MSERIISADSHVQEPDELYDELPADLRERAPRIVTEADGRTYKVTDGKRPRRIDLADTLANEDDQNREFRSDPTGGRDIERRLADQARDGVSAEVLYPNSSLSLYNSPHPGFQIAVAKAYNNWIMALFGPHPDRFVPVAICPVADIHAACAEAERIAKLGFRAVKVPITVRAKPYNHPDYEPFWAICAEAGLVVSFHAFSNAEDQYPEDWGEETGTGGALTLMATSMIDGMNPVTLLIASGVLMRHPTLKFVVVECGAGWLAWLLHVLDEQYDKKHMWIQPRLDLRPGEYFKRQGHVTFSDDPMALKTLEFTGADGLMWGSDYPHDEGTFPHSQDVIERTFAGVDPRHRQQIVHDNAAALYGFARG